MAVRDFNTDHEKHLKAAIDELVASGVDGGFVIFETAGDKFVQFIYSKKDGLTFDLPRLGLSADEQQRVTQLEGLEAMIETEISYQMRVGIDTRMGARVADRVFRDAFRCSERYPVRVTLDI